MQKSRPVGYVSARLCNITATFLFNMVLVSKHLYALMQRVCIRILEDIDHHDHLVIPMQDLMRLKNVPRTWSLTGDEKSPAGLERCRNRPSALSG